MKSWACSDLHGNYNLWRQIKDYCAEDDSIFFLGDAIDRGKYGIEIMLDMLNDGRIRYIKGNHEDMMFHSIQNPDDYAAWSLWVQNGGFDTWEKYYSLAKEQYIIYYAIKAMPNQMIMTNKNNQTIILNHSGGGGGFFPDNTTSVLWDRKHFELPWDLGENFYIIHGHTPVQYLKKYNIDYTFLNQEDNNICAIQYCGGHKIDIDLGSYHSKTAALIDLDTFEVKYFYDKLEVMNV